MEGERPHRSSSTSELFICFTSRLSSSSSSMKISSKSLLSPGRTDKYREPTSSLQSSLSRRLRSNGSIKGGQYSPMFPTGSKKKGCSFETPEPSSPKVTCIGQVRVKTMKQGKKMKSRRRRGDVSFRKTEQSIESQQQQECLPNRNQRWVHLPLSICEALRAFGSEFNCFLPCGGRSSCASGGEIEKEKGEKRANSSCGAVFARWLMALQESKVEKRIEIEEEMRFVALVGEEQGREKRKEEMFVEVREEDEGEEVEEKKVEIQQEGDVGVCVPPRNALLLMRCRSESFRMSSFANRFWDSPAQKEEEEEEDDDEEGEAFEEVAEVKEEEEEHREEEGLEALVLAQAQVVEEPKIHQEEEKEQLDEVVQYKEEEEEELVVKLFEEELQNLLQEEEENVEEEATQLQQSEDEQTQLQQIEEEEEEKEAIFSEEKLGFVHDEEEDQRPSSSVSTATVQLEEETRTSTATTTLEERERKLMEAEEAAEMAEKEEIKSVTVAAVEQKKEQEQENQNLLPECLLLMMYEPKLSMEVLKETWVCSSDFLKLRPGKKGEVMAKEKEKEEAGEEARRVSTGSNPPPPPPANPTHPPASDSAQKPPSMAMVIEQKLVNAVAYEPFALTRCKSEPMRSSAKLAPEACFWKSRKLQSHRPPVGAAGVGF